MEQDCFASRYRVLIDEAVRDGMADHPQKILARGAVTFSTHSVVWFQNESITYEALWKKASAVSRWAVGQGIGPGSRVALLLENGIFFYVAYYGFWQTGATLVPLNTFLHEEELRWIGEDAQVHCAIVSNALVGKLAFWPGKIYTESELVSCLDRRDEGLPLSDIPSCAGPAVVVYTSGTTGRPKGVMLSSRAIMHNVLQGLSMFSFSEDERILCPLPLFHSFPQNACVWMALYAGATVIIISRMARSSFREAVAQLPTIVIGVPAVYGLLCKMDGLSFPSVRLFVTGGDALPTNIRMWFALKYGRALCNGYGLTEMAPMIAVDLDDSIGSPHRIGVPLPGIDVELRDAEDGVGVLWVRGPNRMDGYMNDVQATEKVMRDGWVDTGDLARYDEYGFLVICGRVKELIISKGIKIYPQEIETILSSHYAVSRAAVVGDGPIGEEVPIAHVELRPGLCVDSEELRAWCQAHIAVYKVPHRIIIHDHLPVGPTGKIDKKQLVSR